MKLFLPLVTTVVMGFASAALAADESWQTNYEAALETAKSSDKPVLVDFTGSDWCGWCIRLAKETFDQPKFADYAEKNLVLLEVDYPQGKEQSPELKKQNAELKGKYGIEGFPTLVLLDKNGKEVARQVGYLEGGPDAMIAWIKGALK